MKQNRMSLSHGSRKLSKVSLTSRAISCFCQTYSHHRGTFIAITKRGAQTCQENHERTVQLSHNNIMSVLYRVSYFGKVWSCRLHSVYIAYDTRQKRVSMCLYVWQDRMYVKLKLDSVCCMLSSAHEPNYRLGRAGVVFRPTNQNTLVTWGRRPSLNTLRVLRSNWMMGPYTVHVQR